MNVVIQQTGTGRFLKAPGEWVAEKTHARAFPGSLQALDFCRKEGLRDVHIRLCFSNPRFDIILRPFEPDNRPAVPGQPSPGCLPSPPPTGPRRYAPA